jgi:hypothetical protein
MIDRMAIQMYRVQRDGESEKTFPIRIYIYIYIYNCIMRNYLRKIYV